jgi:hypothetical protein
MKNTSARCGCGCGETTNSDASGRPRRFRKGHNRRGRGNGWNENAYRYVSVDGTKIGQHRHLMQQHLQRKLTRDEVVHHINEDKLDNRIENLVVVSRAEHRRLHRGRKWKPWSSEEKERAVELRARGMTIQNVALALGRSVSSTISHVCERRVRSRGVPAEVETAMK